MRANARHINITEGPGKVARPLNRKDIMLFKHITRPYRMARRRLEISMRKIMLDAIDETVNNRLKSGTFVVTKEHLVRDDSVTLRWTDGTN